MAKYLCEESVLFYPMLKYLPSTIAAAAVLIARLALHRTPLWDDTMRHYIGLDATDVLPCARELTRCIQTQRVKLASHIGHPLCSVKKKYDSEKLYRVGSIELPSEKLFDDVERYVLPPSVFRQKEARRCCLLLLVLVELPTVISAFTCLLASLNILFTSPSLWFV